MNYLKKHGSKLIKNGYQIIPIKPGHKAPRGKGFKGWQSVNATQKTLKGWLDDGYEKYGIGILTANTPAIDLDIRDEKIAKKLLRWCEKKLGAKAYRVGKAPKLLIPCQTAEPFAKISSHVYWDLKKQKSQIEILGNGQQYVALHTHPDTLKPYKWHNGSLLETPRKALPTLTPELAEELIEYFYSIIPNNWEIKKEAKEANPSDADPLEFLKPPLDISDKKVKKALKLLDPNKFEYDEWLTVGMALYHQYRGSSEGFDLWDEWSLRSDKYNEYEQKHKWPSFKSGHDRNPITFASVLKLAKEEYKKKKLKELNIEFAHISEVDSSLGPVDWLVKNYIETNTLGIFFGDPGSYKSFLALDIALHTVFGASWNGNDTKQGPVVYIAGEGFGGLSRRICAWKTEFKRDFKNAPFYFSKQSVNFYDEESAHKVAKAVGAVSGGSPILVVIDTLARNFGPGDENSTADMGVFIEHVDRLIRDKFKCCVLLVHHVGHKDKQRARGSMALKGGVDFEYRVEKPEKLQAKLVCTKMKDGPEPEETYFQGKSVLLDFEDDEEITSLVFSKAESPVKEEKKATLKNPRYQKIIDIAFEMEDGNIIDRDAFKGRLLEERLVKDSADFRVTLHRIEALENTLKREGNCLILIDDFAN